MFDEDAPETPDSSRRHNAVRPRRKKSARAQRHAARKKGRGDAKAPASLLAADSASAAVSVPDVATAPTSPPNDAPSEPVGVAPSTETEAVAAPAAAAASLQDQALGAPPADAAGRPPEAPAIETPEDPEALALVLWQEGRAQEAVELLEREIALERVRAGVRVLAPAEAGGLADQSAAQDQTIVESAPNVPSAADEPVPQQEATSGGTVIALPTAAALAAGQTARARRLPPLVDLVPGPRTAAAATASRRLSPVALLGGAAVACLLATGFLWAESDQAAESGAARPATRSVWPMIASVDGAGQPNVLLPESLANLSENAAAKRPTGGEEAPAPSPAAANRDEQPLMPVAPNDERPAQARSAEAPASAAEAPLTRSIVRPLAPAEASPQTPVDALAGSQLPSAGDTGPAALSAAEPPASVAPNGEPPAEILAGTEAPFDGDDPYAGLSPEEFAAEDFGEETIVAEARMPRPRPEPPARATRTTRAAAPVARSAAAAQAGARRAPAAQAGARRAPAAQARAPAPPADVVLVDPYYAPALAQRRALAERYMAARRAAAQRRAFWNDRIIVLRGRPYQ